MADKPTTKKPQSDRFAPLQKVQQEFLEMVDGKRTLSRGVVTNGRVQTVRIEKGKRVPV